MFNRCLAYLDVGLKSKPNWWCFSVLFTLVMTESGSFRLVPRSNNAWEQKLALADTSFWKSSLLKTTSWIALKHANRKCEDVFLAAFILKMMKGTHNNVCTAKKINPQFCCSFLKGTSNKKIKQLFQRVKREVIFPKYVVNLQRTCPQSSIEGQILFRMIIENTHSSVTGFTLKIKRVQANHELMEIRNKAVPWGSGEGSIPCTSS